jgi:hypothetical protein
MNGGRRAVGQFQHGLKRRAAIANLPGRGVSSRRILLPLHSSSATSTQFFRLFWGEQPPFTPIGRGGRYFFGASKENVQQPALSSAERSRMGSTSNAQSQGAWERRPRRDGLLPNVGEALAPR